MGSTNPAQVDSSNENIDAPRQGVSMNTKAAKTTRTAPFDAAAYLGNEETIAEFLTASLEDPNPEVFLMPLRDSAKARRDR